MVRQCFFDCSWLVRNSANARRTTAAAWAIASGWRWTGTNGTSEKACGHQAEWWIGWVWSYWNPLENTPKKAQPWAAVAQSRWWSYARDTISSTLPLASTKLTRNKCSEMALFADFEWKTWCGCSTVVDELIQYGCPDKAIFGQCICWGRFARPVFLPKSLSSDICRFPVASASELGWLSRRGVSFVELNSKSAFIWMLGGIRLDMVGQGLKAILPRKILREYFFRIGPKWAAGWTASPGSWHCFCREHW